MIEIRTTGTIDTNGNLTASMPETVTPGEHEIIMIIDPDEANRYRLSADSPLIRMIGTASVPMDGRNHDDILYE